MPRCIGFAKNDPVEEYVYFTDENSPAEDFVKDGFEIIYDEVVEDLPSEFPLESYLKVES